ncbi:MAG: hypothetical protein A3F11_00920 [Gammaproteobacteria bacterium RIFCSPHIGHO2_12_FULL_37_14]|nr:MAG: hypothetical protein A3F11_00920 [Gammaproteobacteria bacterium RIFCSPHIGHO2_12_FULL_37_14]
MLNTWNIRWLFLGLFILTNISNAHNRILNRITNEPFSSDEIAIIKQYLFNNIATDEHAFIKEGDGRIIHSIPGAVLASPYNKYPSFIQDYQFHWIRDAAITMQEVVYLYEQANSNEKQRLKTYLINYINFERQAQKQMSSNGEVLGEPKFNIDGTLWQGQWGRPQNDGPALRAMTMVSIAQQFMRDGQEKFVRDVLVGVIIADLDYLVTKWKDDTFDLWEELNDQDHFFTKMVQRKALIIGSHLIKSLGDVQRADSYLNTANHLTQSLQKHWNAGRGYLSETVNQQDQRGGGLDSSIILGVLYGNMYDLEASFAVNDDRVMSSVYFIRNAFSGLYRLNIENANQPPLLGRYPNDVYDGNQSLYGNPWVITTNALAQYYYTLANVYLKIGKINVTSNNLLFFKQINPKLVMKEEEILFSANPNKFYTVINSLIEEGDKTLSIIKRYAVCYVDSSCYHFSEQIDRTSGQQTSAKDLTWGYATILTAMQARLATEANFN